MPVCTIVGAGAGVSAAVARSFGKEGYAVALIARKVEKLDGLRESLSGEGIENAAFAGDAKSEDSLRHALNSVHSELGVTEVLLYNAYSFQQGAPTKLTPAQLAEDFQVNVGGALVAAQAVVPSMRTAKRGTILLTGGGLALNPAAAASSLAIGKAGLRSLAFTLFQELSPEGIHAATVTICGTVQEETHFSPDRIAAEFLKLHKQARKEWTPETIYK